MKFLKRCIASEAVVRRCSSKFSKIHRKHLCQRLFLNNVAGLSPATLLKKRLQHTCFAVNFAKFPRMSIVIEHLRWLLLLTVRKLLAHHYFYFILFRGVIDYCLLKRTFLNMLKCHGNLVRRVGTKQCVGMSLITNSKFSCHL